MGTIFDDDLELGIHDEVAMDLTRVAPFKARLWKLRKGKTYDPVLGESSRPAYAGPWEMNLTMESHDSSDWSFDAEEGGRKDRVSILWLARAELERVSCKEPLPGDVFELWLKRRPKPRYYSVNNVKREGRAPEGTHILYQIECKAVTSFDPGRVIDGQCNQ